MKKSFRFVVLTDTHVSAPGKGVDGTWWNKVLGSQSQRIAESIIETITALSPDFIIHCGDFTEDSTMDSYHFGLEVMQQMGCPWYVVPGNHDTWATEVRSAFRSRYSLETEGTTD
jgi:3',5'-cyclic AMP phosphodiesterase CpdA